MHLDKSKFVRFVATTGRTTPYVTMDSIGRMYFSSAATRLYEIVDTKFEAAHIFYNEESNLIAVKLLEKSEEGALPLKSPKQGGTFINTKSFAIKYEMMEGDKLSEKYKGKYLVEKGDIEGIGKVFFINLNQKK